MDAKSSRERQPGEVRAFLDREQAVIRAWTPEDENRAMADQRARIDSMPPRPPAPPFPNLRREVEERVIARYGGHSLPLGNGVFVDTSLYGIAAAMMAPTDCGHSCNC